MTLSLGFGGTGFVGGSSSLESPRDDLSVFRRNLGGGVFGLDGCTLSLIGCNVVL